MLFYFLNDQIGTLKNNKNIIGKTQGNKWVMTEWLDDMNMNTMGLYRMRQYQHCVAREMNIYLQAKATNKDDRRWVLQM